MQPLLVEERICLTPQSPVYCIGPATSTNSQTGFYPHPAYFAGDSPTSSLDADIVHFAIHPDTGFTTGLD